jgi:hypothetical protein
MSNNPNTTQTLKQKKFTGKVKSDFKKTPQTSKLKLLYLTRIFVFNIAFSKRKFDEIIKNGQDKSNGLKRYISIQFAKMGFDNNLESINNIIQNSEYYTILKIIID